MTTLSVTPTSSLPAGSEATVCITGGPPYTGVTVDINNGGDETDTLNITLDENGDGCGSWTVPNSSNWGLARFDYGDCPTITRPIT